jgi:phosphatidylglycerophosphatase A
MSKLIKLITTFFGVGYIPYISGTVASAVAIPIYLFIAKNIYIYLAVTAILTILGFMASGKAEKIFKQKDSRFIVIDEVSGMLIALAGLSYSTKGILAAFVFFRILDTTKIFPINRLQYLKGSAGVMCDDLLASVYTIIFVQIFLKFTS